MYVCNMKCIKVNITLVILLGILVCFSSFLILKEVKRIMYENKHLILENTLLKETCRRQYSIAEITVENIQLSDGKHLLCLKDLLAENHKLIMKFSEAQCSVCVDFVLEKLKELLGDNLNDNLIIIGEFSDKRTFLNFRKRKGVTSNIYYKQISPLEPNEEDLPSLFLLNKDLKMKCLFYPMKEIPYLLYDYIETIKSKIILY